MKKNPMSIGLVLTISGILFSAEKGYNPLVKASFEPASVIGTKGIDVKVRQSLSKNQRKTIYGIEHPGCIRSLYGFNNQVISEKHKDALGGMPKEIRKGLIVRVKKIEGSCCINPRGADCNPNKANFFDLYANKAWVPAAVMSVPFGVSFLFKMLCGPIAIAPWAACTVPIILAPPACAAVSTEVGICTYHRCCVEDEIWYSNDNSESDSESEEQNN